MCLPLRDFIFVTKVLRFPLSPWLVVRSHTIKTLPVGSFHVLTKTNVTLLVATPRHLFNPPVTGSHASICMVSTVLNGLASLEPGLDLSQFELWSIAHPNGYGNRVRDIFPGIVGKETTAALVLCRYLSIGEQLFLLQCSWFLHDISPGICATGRLSQP